MEDLKSCFYEGKTQKLKENFSKGGGGGTKIEISKFVRMAGDMLYSRHIFDIFTMEI